MARTHLLPFTLALALAFAVGSTAAVTGCSRGKAEAARKPAPKRPAHVETEAERAAREAREHEAEIRHAFPLFGLVTGVELAVRKEADPTSTVLGWLRVGSLVHLQPRPVKTTTCSSGWYRIYPKGYACTGEGIEVNDHPEAGAIPPAARDAPLPYAYYYVKETMVPEYHRLPSRDEQRAAEAFAKRYQAFVADGKARRAQMLMDGKLRNEPTRPAVVARYLDRGFFLAVTGVEVRAFRRFVRTVRGTYVKEARLERRSSPTFHGIELDDTHTLPIAFALRTFRPMIEHTKSDGTVRMVEDASADPIQRQTIVPDYGGRVRIGTRIFHKLDNNRFVRSWFIGVAKPFTPPFHVADDEPWVHVDLSQQTLVLFRGHHPIYATLISERARRPQHADGGVHHQAQARRRHDGQHRSRRERGRPLPHRGRALDRVLLGIGRPSRRLLARCLRPHALPRLREPLPPRCALHLQHHLARDPGRLARRVDRPHQLPRQPGRGDGLRRAMGDRVRICFVCLGNICRSPTAEAVMRHLVRGEGLESGFAIDSAGTGDWHVGEPPDRRSQETARRRGFPLEGQARQFARGDFARFDYVVAMDASNREKLERMAPDAAARAKVHLLRDFDPASRGQDVPDPYFGGDTGFEHVFDVVETACRGLLAHLRRERDIA